MGHDLRFSELREANSDRQIESFPKCREWTLPQWSNAAMGEFGEAANIIKKLDRLRDDPDARQNGRDPEILNQQLASELADAVIYLDLLAIAAKIDLGLAVARKFNEVSQRIGSRVVLRERITS